ncbi:hypothetical protein [Caulobacter vibrioides]|uniref:hypothetical protein n=1 Tax=Caulobacter vibrioides TaxID=155892 RepID=UPI000BB4AD6A|nr:hypothetical protein [Caulobacter vibrioides]ATC26499.1 hypothetical protein CA608_19180 [Caulobacter vibrioides]PLR12321.1 hypothetical protein CVUC_08810 [Caulobacter vibrioides]
MRRTTLVAVALSVCSCGPTGAGKDLAAAGLRDPSSAQFRDVRARGDVVCGEVNGKNGFGAYVGFRRFISVPRTREVSLAPSRDDGADAGSTALASLAFERAWAATCPPGKTSPDQDAAALARHTDELQRTLEETKKYGAKTPD